jgi:hypothetical protein
METDTTNQTTGEVATSPAPITLQEALRALPKTTPRKKGYELERVTPDVFPIHSRFEVQLHLKGRKNPTKANSLALIQGNRLTSIGSEVVLRGSAFHAILPQGEPVGSLCKCGKIASYSNIPPDCEPGYCNDMADIEAMFENLCLTSFFAEQGIDPQELMREATQGPFLGNILTTAILELKAFQLSLWDSFIAQRPVWSVYSLGLESMSLSVNLLKEAGYNEEMQKALIKHLAYEGFIQRILGYFLSIHKCQYDWRDDDDPMTMMIQSLVSPRDLHLLFASILKTDPLEKITPETPIWLYLSEIAHSDQLSPNYGEAEIRSLADLLIAKAESFSNFMFAVNLNPLSPLAESFGRFIDMRNPGTGLLPFMGFTFNAFSGPLGLEKARTIELVNKLEALGAVHAPSFTSDLSIYVDFNSPQGVQPVYEYWYKKKNVLFSTEADLNAFEKNLESISSLAELVKLFMEVEQANAAADKTLSAYNERF